MPACYVYIYKYVCVVCVCVCVCVCILYDPVGEGTKLKKSKLHKNNRLVSSRILQNDCALLRQRKDNFKDPHYKRILFSYAILLKLIFFLDLVTICITHERQIMSGKSIIWLACLHDSLSAQVYLVDILDLKQCRTWKCKRSRSGIYIHNRCSGR